MSSWVERVASDLAAGAALAREAAASGKLPTISSVPANVAETCSYTAAATVLVAMLLAAPRARRAVWDAVDTALAVVCLVLLLGVVLGMPFGEDSLPECMWLHGCTHAAAGWMRLCAHMHACMRFS
eukprot:175011-Chlamydomonas_euryale.AAC.6